MDGWRNEPSEGWRKEKRKKVPSDDDPKKRKENKSAVPIVVRPYPG
jgi:hypothetical protein